MTSLRSLIRGGDTARVSPTARRIAVALAVLTPLLIAGVAVTALRGGAADASDHAVALPAAVVNQDTVVYIEQNGAKTPVLAGKLLVSELTSGSSGQGFTWDVTDADTASAGLRAGSYSAVVTIPATFSKDYVSVSGSTPAQAQLQVETNGASGYVTEQLASALSADLQQALSTQVTKQFVTSTLGAFTTLNGSIGEAAAGATKLETGAGQLSTGAGQLSTGLAGAATGATQLDTGAQALAGGLATISTATTDLPDYAGKLADGTKGVSAGIGVLNAQIDDRRNELIGGVATQQAVVDELTAAVLTNPALQPTLDKATAVRDQLAFSAGLLTLDGLGGGLLRDGSDLVSAGAAQFAADLPQLSDGIAAAASGSAQLATGTAALSSGLGELSTGSAQLASGAQQLASGTTQLAGGLGQAATAIPSYTTDQQDGISTVVSTPIVTTTTDIAALPSPAAAIAAVAVPLALWIGALAIYLLLVPYSRRQLASTRSTFRVVVGALAPAALLALIQGVIAAVLLVVTGADAPALLAGTGFSVLMSLSFVTLHQGLVALLGQAGRILSLALVVVQVVAATVLLPTGLSAPFYAGLADLLPLSHAITGMHALLGGGSPAVVVQEALVLVVFGAIGLALSLIAATRARGRSVIPTDQATAVAPALA